MPFLTWDESLAVNVEDIDSQHKRLFELGNAVAATVARGFDREAVGAELRTLCDYAVEHFATEEGLMDMDAYPEYDQHLGEHMHCTTRALDFLEAFSEGREVDMGEFLRFVDGWIREHTMRMDMTLATYLRLQRLRKEQAGR